MIRALAIAALLGLAVAGCGGGSGTSRSSSPVDLALSYAPKAAGPITSFEFSDAAAIRKAAGYGESTYSLWKPSDVTWEAETIVSTSAPPLLLTGLASSFDFGPMGRKLEGCKYHRETIGDATAYVAVDESAVLHCMGPYGNGVPLERNIAVLPSQHLVVRSASIESLTSALKQEGDLHHDATLSALIAKLHGADAIAAAPDPAYCTTLTKGFVGRAASADTIAAAMKRYPAGRPYAGFALGVEVGSGALKGHLVFHYGDAGTAGTDARTREHLLRTEKSVQVQRPYAQLLRVEKTAVDGKDFIVDVGPGQGSQLPLYQMWLRFDLAFARC